MSNLNFSEQKFRASSFHKLCGTSNKAGEILTTGAKTFLNEIYEESLFGKKPEIYSEELEKGKRCEAEAISLVRKKYQKFFTPVSDSNENKIENKYATGHVDGLFAPVDGLGEVHEIKTPYKNSTWFRWTEKTNKERGYIIQVKIYLWILGLETGYIHVCGINTPQDLVYRDFSKKSYLLDIIGEEKFTELEEAIYNEHRFDIIPEDQRVKTYKVVLNQEDKDFFESRAKLAREYLQNLANAESINFAVQKSVETSFVNTLANSENLSITNKIISKYAEFGIELKFDEKIEGASVTQFRFTPIRKGVKIDKASRYNADIRALLKTESVLIETPIPKTSQIGIQIPNETRKIIETPKLEKRKDLVLQIGENIEGESYKLDLAKAPHILIGGATGSGKSVLLSSIIAQLQGNEAKHVILDPKNEFRNIGSKKDHFEIYQTLKEGVEEIKKNMEIKDKTKIKPLVLILDEMETLLSDQSKIPYEIDLKEYPEFLRVYNQSQTFKKVKNPEHQLQLKIKKLQPKIGEACRELIEYIVRLGRSEKVHFIGATQNPTVKNISSSIKANCPTRICLRVASETNSRVILDDTGGEKLLGNGDMLLLSPFESGLVRLQGYFLETN